MPPTNIVRDIRTSVDTKLLPVVPRKWIHQFNFGIQAYGLTPFQCIPVTKTMLSMMAVFSAVFAIQ